MYKPVPGLWLTFSFFSHFTSSSHPNFPPLQSWTHNIQREREFLRKLVKAHIITDLTSGIWGGTTTVLKGTATSIQLRTRAARGPWQESQLRDTQCSWKVYLTCSVCLHQSCLGSSSSWSETAGPMLGTAGGACLWDETSSLERTKIGQWNKANCAKWELEPCQWQ